ncbi:MAG TPA: DUF3667 domain-containing protein [Steroidobacteraceae bacterium]|nr:DUF3667 domain-containing protein [Steroidobacteraceae bacterium]
MAALFHDVLHDLAHLDSRVWRTLVALLFQPGRLTNEFIVGRRTFYLPPFRLYVVLSLVYFLLPSFSHKTAFDIDDNNKVVVTDMNSKEGQQAIRDAMQELKHEFGGAKGGIDTSPKAPAPPTAAPAPADAKVRHPVDYTRPDTEPFLQDVDCTTAKTDLFGGKSGWLQPRLVQGCEHLKTVSERDFMRALRNNFPKMMFIFLPLIALVSLVLYVFRRRTYVEHLLFYVHFHAFAFLLLTLQGIVTAILGLTGHFSFVAGLVSFATFVYLFVYLFKAMRSVYHQGRLMTTLKYVAVLTAYGICLLLTLLGMAAYTAFTV